MSAFMVDRNHIRFLVATARQYAASNYGFSWFYEGKYTNLDTSDRDQASKFGQILWDANLKSIHARYPDTMSKPENIPGLIGETYIYAHGRDWPREIAPVQVLKAIAGLSYQSCEYDEWEDSEAYAILESLKSAAIHNLPGYENATWEISEQEVK